MPLKDKERKREYQRKYRLAHYIKRPKRDWHERVYRLGKRGCELCGETYQPTNFNQKYCADCKKFRTSEICKIAVSRHWINPKRDGKFIGEIVLGYEVGIRNCHKYFWQVCRDCGKEWWVYSTNDKPMFDRCSVCAQNNCYFLGKRREKSSQWKGGKTKTPAGYIKVRIYLDDPFYPMAIASYILEHRLVMAQSLGRCLQKWEGVHHRNGIKDDNRLENLQLVDRHNHKTDLSAMQQRIDQLERENRLLAWQLQEVKNENLSG